MTTGTSPTLELLVRAPQAIQQFREMAAAANELRSALAGIQSGSSGASSTSAMTRLNAEVKELRTGLTAAQLQNEQLMRQVAELSSKNIGAIAAEKAAIVEKGRVEREEAKKTAAAKKEAAEAALGASASFGRVTLGSGLGFASGALRAGSADQEIQQARDLELWLERGRQARAAQAAAAAETNAALRSQQANEARLRAYGVTQARALADDESRTRSTGIAQYRAITENEARARQLGIAQQRATRENELADRRVGLAQIAAAQEEEARVRKMGVLMAQAQAEDQRRAAVQRNAAAAAGAGGGGSGTARSALRGAAGAGGGMFLTYGQNIPALAATFAGGAAIKESIKDSAEFEKQMAFVRIASDESAESIKKLSDEVLNLGGKTAFGPIQMAEGLRKLAEAGFTTKDSMTALLPVMQLAQLGGQEVGAAAEMAQGFMHAFGLEAEDMRHIGDVVTKAANISAVSVNDMGQSLKQASTVAKQFGISIEDMSAMLATLGTVGIKGSAAGTALMNMLRELDPASAKARRALAAVGVDIEDKLTHKIKPIIPLLQEFATKFGQFDQISQNRLSDDYFNNRGAKAFLNLLSEAQNKLPEFRAAIDNASEGIGYMQRSTNILGETASQAWDRFKGGLESVLIKAANTKDFVEILDKLTKVVTSPEFLSGVTSLVSNFAKLTSIIIDHGGAIAGLVGSYLLFGKVLPAIATGATALFAALEGGMGALLARGALATRGGVIGLVVWGAWELAYHIGQIEAVRNKLASLFEFMAGKVDLNNPTAKLDADLKALDDRIAKAALPQDKEALKQKRFELGAERQALLRQMGLGPDGRPPTRAASSVDPFEVDGRQGSGISGTPRLGAGDRHYDRINPDEEAIKKAQAARIEALAKINLAAQESEAKHELAILETKHKYQLISEEEYVTAVDELQDKRATKEREDVDTAIKALETKIKSMRRVQDVIRETTALDQLRAKQTQLASDAEFVAEQRRLKVDGERVQRQREINAAVAGYTSELGKIGEKLKLQQQKDREGIENALLPGVDSVQRTARLGVESAYLTEQEKLKKEIAELEAKSDEKSKEKLAALQAILPVLQAQKGVQSEIAALEAKANYARQREFSYGWRESFNKYVEDASNAAQQARDLFATATKGMEDAIVKFATTGKLSFKDFANTVIQELLRIEARKTAAGLMGLLGGVVSSIGGVKGVSHAQNLGEAAGAFAQEHSGGIVGFGAATRFMSSSVFAGAPRFHGGGLVGHDEVPIIAKKGEGVFTPEQMSAMGGDTIQINVTVNAESGKTQVSGSNVPDLRALGERMAQVARAEIMQQKKAGGLLADTR
jgi:TP901 family phage tail tape measure protein/lambda family phage tail tape measure protein